MMWQNKLEPFTLAALLSLKGRKAGAYPQIFDEAGKTYRNHIAYFVLYLVTKKKIDKAGYKYQFYKTY